VEVRRQSVEPEAVGEPKRTADSDEANYSADALWQKGSYALRKLYHDSDRPLLVVYTSPTCGPCHVLKPQLKRVLDELGGAAQGVEIDIEADPEIAQQAGVTGTPTVQLFFRKELKQQFKGVQQRSTFRAAIDNLLGVPA
jgi:thioredoxin reductase (NADPH)